MTAIQLTLTPLRSGLLAGHASTATVLVRVRAPAAPADAGRIRRPLNLSLVIDRSGSMSGRPLAEAKRCAEFIVKGLSPDDRASVVAYCHEVDVLAPSQIVGNRRALLKAIRSIHEAGMTALYDGWRLGADQALFGQADESLSRVLLMSDGNANQGLTQPNEIAAKVAAVAAKGVSTSTYGLGHHFNEYLMLEMAQAGQGNGYYGESAEDLMDPFRQELDLLNALCARHLSLSLEGPAGVGIRLLNNFSQDASGRWRLPDLACGGEAWALAEIRVPAELAAQSAGDPVEILRAAIAFEPLAADVTAAAPARLALPFLPAGAYEALAVDETVSARTQELRAADIQEQARTAARNGQWDRVDELLAIARHEAGDNPWLEQSIAALARYATQRDMERFSKEAHYGSSRLRSRLVGVDESLACFDADAEIQRSSFLRRKVEQGKRMEGDDSSQ